MRARTVGRFRLVHKWSSLVCTAFLLTACLTGLPLIFGDEIEQLADGAASRPTVETSPERSLDELVQSVRERYPDAFLQFVFWPDERRDALGIGIANRLDASDEDVRRLLVNLRTGAIEDQRKEGRLIRFARELHENLFLGPIGSIVLGVAAAALLVSLASGVAVYRPFMRRLDFGAVRSGSQRLAWLDRHNLIGVATLVWVVVVGATGFVNTLEERLFAAWQAERVPALMAPYAHRPPASHLSSLEGTVRTARGTLAGMAPASVTFPGTRFATPRHYFVWMHGTRSLTKRLFTPVLIDAESGALASAESLPWYLRLLEVSRPLHFGDYGGLPLKLIWAAMDLLLIVLTVSGGYLWLAGRAKVAQEGPSP